MITTLFYASSTLDSPNTCHNKFRGNTCCKHAEFINVWLDYIRYVYGKQEHVYIIDNGSPYLFKDFFDFSKEDVEFLDIDQYNYNENVYVHVKRFNENLNHGGGVVRGFHEGFKFSIKNDLDFYFVEADSLSMINLKHELLDQDLVTNNIIHGKNGADENGCIDTSNSAIRKELLTDHITQVPNVYGRGELTVFDSLDQSIQEHGICTTQPNYQYYGIIENGPYINYHKDYRMKKIEGDWIHDCNVPTLAHFMYRNNPVVESEYSVEYLRRL